MAERRKSNPKRTHEPASAQSQPGRRGKVDTSVARPSEAGRAPVSDIRSLEGISEVLRTLARNPVGTPADVTDILRIIGEAVEVDRVYIFQYSQEPKSGRRLANQTYEWVAPNITPQIDNPDFQDFPVEQMASEWTHKLDRGEYVTVLRDEVGGFFHDSMQQQDILSMIFAPITVGNTLWGFVGYDDCHEPRQWSREETVGITALAGALGLAAGSGQIGER